MATIEENNRAALSAAEDHKRLRDLHKTAHTSRRGLETERQKLQSEAQELMETKKVWEGVGSVEKCGRMREGKC